MRYMIQRSGSAIAEEAIAEATRAQAAYMVARIMVVKLDNRLDVVNLEGQQCGTRTG